MPDEISEPTLATPEEWAREALREQKEQDRRIVLAKEAAVILRGAKGVLITTSVSARDIIGLAYWLESGLTVPTTDTFTADVDVEQYQEVVREHVREIAKETKTPERFFTDNNWGPHCVPGDELDPPSGAEYRDWRWYERLQVWCHPEYLIKPLNVRPGDQVSQTWEFTTAGKKIRGGAVTASAKNMGSNPSLGFTREFTWDANDLVLLSHRPAPEYVDCDEQKNAGSLVRGDHTPDFRVVEVLEESYDGVLLRVENGGEYRVITVLKTTPFRVVKRERA